MRYALHQAARITRNEQRPCDPESRLHAIQNTDTMRSQKQRATVPARSYLSIIAVPSPKRRTADHSSLAVCHQQERHRADPPAHQPTSLTGDLTGKRATERRTRSGACSACGAATWREPRTSQHPRDVVPPGDSHRHNRRPGPGSTNGVAAVPCVVWECGMCFALARHVTAFCVSRRSVAKRRSLW